MRLAAGKDNVVLGRTVFLIGAGRPSPLESPLFPRWRVN